MSDLTPEHQQIVDRLTALLLRDVISDLVSILRNVDPTATKQLLGEIEQRVMESIARFRTETEEGAAYPALLDAVSDNVRAALASSVAETGPEP